MLLMKVYLYGTMTSDFKTDEQVWQSLHCTLGMQKLLLLNHQEWKAICNILPLTCEILSPSSLSLFILLSLSRQLFLPFYCQRDKDKQNAPWDGEMCGCQAISSTAPLPVITAF